MKECFYQLSLFSRNLNEKSILCILTTPADAAMLLPYLEKHNKFQLWVALKTKHGTNTNQLPALPEQHASLIILSRYKESLKHTKTRIKYTYCPTCRKTTKDYGGKKHTYHEYGTLISDVWRDIECNPYDNIDSAIVRLRDLFGLDPFINLYLVDMRKCKDIIPASHEAEPAIKHETSGIQSVQCNRLIAGDCLDVLNTIPTNSIDFCFADPPYNLKKKYDKWDDALESVEYFRWCDKWLSELYRILKPGRTLAVLNIPLWAARHYQFLSLAMDYQAWIVWDAISFPVRMIMPSHYVILCFSKGSPRQLPGLDNNGMNEKEKESLSPLGELYCCRAGCIDLRRRLGNPDISAISDLWHDIHRLKHNSRRVDHPCQLPPSLMRRLFALFTKPDEIVLDCFNGAGTSTLTAQQMSRRYLGIELSAQYHEIALRRHELLSKGVDPFGKQNTIPSVKNSQVQRMSKQKYHVSKKTLQLEVKKIGKDLGHLPTKDEVKQYSKYLFSYFEEYFVSWGEVCAAARTTGMSENPLIEKKQVSIKQMNLFSME
ncbi:MAG: site-specific DNA-methyltransferase [Nitrospirae bacterium]|nr:site-specific DNA-methyltransferase [Nitrospirota bacterium]